MKRFSLGEFAILSWAHPQNVDAQRYVGEQCVVLYFDPHDEVLAAFGLPQPDYAVRFLCDNRKAHVRDQDLRKIPPREEPESITRREECEA